MLLNYVLDSLKQKVDKNLNLDFYFFTYFLQLIKKYIIDQQKNVQERQVKPK